MEGATNKWGQACDSAILVSWRLRSLSQIKWRMIENRKIASLTPCHPVRLRW